MTWNRLCFGLKMNSRTASTCNAVLDCIIQSWPGSEVKGRGLAIDDSQGEFSVKEREPVNEEGESERERGE